MRIRGNAVVNTIEFPEDNVRCFVPYPAERDQICLVFRNDTAMHVDYVIGRRQYCLRFVSEKRNRGNFSFEDA